MNKFLKSFVILFAYSLNSFSSTCYPKHHRSLKEIVQNFIGQYALMSECESYHNHNWWKGDLFEDGNRYEYVLGIPDWQDIFRSYILNSIFRIIRKTELSNDDVGSMRYLINEEICRRGTLLPIRITDYFFITIAENL